MRLIKSNWSASFFNKTNTITDMKRSVLVLSAILFSVLSFAQTEEGTVTVRAGQDLVKILPHNVVYLLPEFMEGTVDFTDGSSSSGRLNVCCLDNSIRFIHSTGDTLLLSNADRVARVIVDGKVLMKMDGIFLRQVAVYGSKSLCERRRLILEENTTDAGYSGVPATSTAKRGRVVSVNPRHMELGERDIDYRMKTDFILTDGEKIYTANTASFSKFFPEKKKEIRSYVKTHKTDFKNKASLAQLFMFCAEQQ